MRLGLVQRGNYKTFEYDDLTGYELEVNGFCYNFGEIIAEAQRRIRLLWNVDYQLSSLQKRLHFSEERFFNRMLKSQQYGIFNHHTGAHICLGLVSQSETHNLVIHELAHEMHYQQGTYNRASEIVQEAVAILAEEEFGVREFSYDPHFTSQQLLHQLKQLKGFGNLTFAARWKMLTDLETTTDISFLINRLCDANSGNQLQQWLYLHIAEPMEAQVLLNQLAVTTQNYALYNRELLFSRICQLTNRHLSGNQSGAHLARALRSLLELDHRYPQENLAELISQAFSRLN